MKETRLGKIRSIAIGYGGYQDAQFGLIVDLGADGWGVGDFIGPWARDPDSHCKWTVADQKDAWFKVMLRLRELLTDANKPTLDKLKGVPVEVTFIGNKLESWRVLKEVV